MFTVFKGYQPYQKEAREKRLQNSLPMGKYKYSRHFSLHLYMEKWAFLSFSQHKSIRLRLIWCSDEGFPHQSDKTRCYNKMAKNYGCMAVEQVCSYRCEELFFVLLNTFGRIQKGDDRLFYRKFDFENAIHSFPTAHRRRHFVCHSFVQIIINKLQCSLCWPPTMERKRLIWNPLGERSISRRDCWYQINSNDRLKIKSTETLPFVVCNSRTVMYYMKKEWKSFLCHH